MNQKSAAKATNDPYIDQNLTLMSPAGDACYGKTVSVWMLLANGCNNCFPFQGNTKHEGAHSFSNSLQNYIPAIRPIKEYCCSSEMNYPLNAIGIMKLSAAKVQLWYFVTLMLIMPSIQPLLMEIIYVTYWLAGTIPRRDATVFTSK